MGEAGTHTNQKLAPGVARVSHILLEVSDLDRAVDFYVGLLAFQVRERGTVSDGRPFVTTEQGLGLTRSAAIAMPASFDHLAFRYPEGIEALMEVLEDAGVDYEPPRRTPYGLSIYFRDPDGYRIECHDSTGFGGDQVLV